METKLRIGIVNFDPIPLDKKANLDKIHYFVREACLQQTDLLVFPAMCLTGDLSGNPEIALSLSESAGDFYVDQIHRLSMEKGLWIIFGGTEPVPGDPSHAWETAFVCSPDGQIRTIHRIQTEHLSWCPPGDEPGLIDTPWGRIGIGVGEDILEYPEIERLMVGWDCRLILSVSATKSHASENPKSWEWYIRSRIDSITARDAVRLVFTNLCGSSFPGGSCAAQPMGWNTETDYLLGDITCSKEALWCGEISMEPIFEGAITLENNFVPFAFSKLYEEIAQDQKEGHVYSAKQSMDGPVIALARTTTAAWGNVERNVKHMTKFIEEAAEKHADFILFPETILQGYHYQEPEQGNPCMQQQLAEPLPGPVSSYFSLLSQKYSMYILYGFSERAGDLVYNSAAVICPDGRQLVYRKFSPHGPENYWCASGTEPLIFDTEWGKAGVIICMDGHSEPEIARYYASKVCSFLLHMATTTGNRWYRQCRLLPYVDRDGMGFATVNTTGFDGPGDEAEYRSVSYIANLYRKENRLQSGFHPVTGSFVDLHGMAAEEKDDQGLSTGRLDLSLVGFKQTLNAVFYAREYAKLGEKMEAEQTYLYDLWNSHQLSKIRKAVKDGLLTPVSPTRLFPADEAGKKQMEQQISKL